MKELKFRAWDKIRKRMIYPNEPYKETRGMDYYTDILLVDMDGHISAYTDDDGGKEGLWEHSYDVDVVLMQYTGLHDKWGIEIYEGDIVKIIYSMSWMTIPEIIIEQVKLVNGAFMPFYWLREDEDHEIDYLINLATIEVIGNIFENPALLKEVK